MARGPTYIQGTADGTRDVITTERAVRVSRPAARRLDGLLGRSGADAEPRCAPGGRRRLRERGDALTGLWAGAVLSRAGRGVRPDVRQGPPPAGLDDVFAEEYPRSVYDTHPTSLPDGAYQDNWIGRRTEQLLREAPEDRPWFCQVNFVKPHNPWDVTERMHGWYRDPDVEFPDPVAGTGTTSTSTTRPNSLAPSRSATRCCSTSRRTSTRPRTWPTTGPAWSSGSSALSGAVPGDLTPRRPNIAA